MSRQCHTPQPENQDGLFFAAEPNPQAKQYHDMDWSEQADARKNFSFMCKLVLDKLENFPILTNNYYSPYMPDAMNLADRGNKTPYWVLRILNLIFAPTWLLISTYRELREGKFYQDVVRDGGVAWGREMPALPFVYYGTLAYTLKYISRFMNQHALMIASFFRVNARRLQNKQPLELDIGKFVEMCKKDIADGPNPPPEPPEYDGEPYSPFSPGKMEREQREAKERQAELRARRDARDPLMEGLDYPETYASASDAY